MRDIFRREGLFTPDRPREKGNNRTHAAYCEKRGERFHLSVGDRSPELLLARVRRSQTVVELTMVCPPYWQSLCLFGRPRGCSESSTRFDLSRRLAETRLRLFSSPVVKSPHHLRVGLKISQAAAIEKESSRTFHKISKAVKKRICNLDSFLKSCHAGAIHYSVSVPFEEGTPA